MTCRSPCSRSPKSGGLPGPSNCRCRSGPIGDRSGSARLTVYQNCNSPYDIGPVHHRRDAQRVREGDRP
jgi:hypothetical protein